MLIPSLLIVTDRGGLRAYKITENPNRTPGLHLLDSFEAQEAHGRYQDKVTDRAGQFQASGTAGGRQTGGAAEHPTIDRENDRRACKHVAEHINALIVREKPEGWLLAVPAPIKQTLLDHLSPDAARRLIDMVAADLLRVEPSKITNHFPVLQHA